MNMYKYMYVYMYMYLCVCALDGTDVHHPFLASLLLLFDRLSMRSAIVAQNLSCCSSRFEVHKLHKVPGASRAKRNN